MHSVQRCGKGRGERGFLLGKYGAQIENHAVAFDARDDGDSDWLTSPRIDSYHTVWMQLHEDLLLALAYGQLKENDKAKECLARASMVLDRLKLAAERLSGIALPE